MAAERLAATGHAVVVIDRMPSVARKFLMAGRGGLNLTHSEPLDGFLTRYGANPDVRLLNSIRAFPPHEAIAFAEGLGQATFVGTSGRVFPKAMKASPLLRAWLIRLVDLGVTFRLRTTWTGFAADGALRLETTGETREERFDAVVLALGGASWPRLGSNGDWVSILSSHDIEITPLSAANAGVLINWSNYVKQKCAGKPLKRIAVKIEGEQGGVRGEAIVTTTGLEGGAIYANGAALTAALATGQPVHLDIDLRYDISAEVLAGRLAWAPTKQSLANTLRKQGGLDATAIAMLNETTRFAGPLPREPAALAERMKSARFPVDGLAGIARAISTAGGVPFTEIDDQFMLRRLPGVFLAGEMLDWSAPTGGYLLQACFATAVATAGGVTAWLRQRPA